MISDNARQIMLDPMRPIAILFVLLAGCSRAKDAPPDAAADASASASASASSSESPTPRREEASRTHASPVEARHLRTAHLADEPLLAPNAAALRAHFGGEPSRYGIDVAEVGRRRALLVVDDTKPPSDATPIVLFTSDTGAPVWVKERPAAGILAPAGPLAIAPGPHGRVAFAAFDAPTSSVALRLWDEDGAPFADFSAMDADACDFLSVLYWPRVGWILVAVKAGATRAQLLRESGQLAWRRGIDIGARPRIPSRASLAIDTDDSFVLVERAQVDGDRDRVFAFRYDVSGNVLWPSPLDLGETKLPRGERVPLVRPRYGVVRATLDPGTKFVEIDANGRFVAP
ncbi:MAG TPA: hypothetical protein VIF62_15465 [Labilithrix sp.]